MDKKNQVLEKIIEMCTDGKHGDALSREDAIWLVKNHGQFSDSDLAQMIGEGAVSSFRKLSDLVSR